MLILLLLCLVKHGLCFSMLRFNLDRRINLRDRGLNCQSDSDSPSGSDDYDFNPTPFDSTDLFSREDDIQKQIKEIEKKQKEQAAQQQTQLQSDEDSYPTSPEPFVSMVSTQDDDENEVYGINTDDNDDPNWVPSIDDSEWGGSGIIRYLKDVYIGTEFDSPKKKEARYVVRNITGFSVAIGIIFTITFYASDGKFISYKGDGSNIEALYDGKASYIQPDGLIENNSKNNNAMKYFDDTVKSDIYPTSPRF